MTIQNTLLYFTFATAVSLPAAAQEDSATAADVQPTVADVAQALEGSIVDPVTAARSYSLREGWFVEAGLDMTCYYPYGFDFAQVFPKGRTEGLNVAFGKHFSRDIGLRFRLNWENGLPFFRNKRLAWVGPIDPESQESLNMDKGGAVFMYMDVPVSLVSLVGGHRLGNRRWDVLVVPRVGLGGNMALSSWSPYVGLGCGYTYRLTNRVTLYSDLTYAGITSEFFSDVPGAGTGMGVAWGFNGIISLHCGVQIGI